MHRSAPEMLQDITEATKIPYNLTYTVYTDSTPEATRYRPNLYSVNASSRRATPKPNYSCTPIPAPEATRCRITLPIQCTPIPAPEATRYRITLTYTVYADPRRGGERARKLQDACRPNFCGVPVPTPEATRCRITNLSQCYTDPSSGNTDIIQLHRSQLRSLQA
ncbi:unnamed protein product [Mytilus edulis]|uniref:Uncharacterized protein n=1 Tax=Mytilus edulis TaxID=6550 RepID=A0A8S3SW56_MYTED|nr:unnamed protein product [Mytilus edulis]